MIKNKNHLNGHVIGMIRVINIFGEHLLRLFSSSKILFLQCSTF